MRREHQPGAAGDDRASARSRGGPDDLAPDAQSSRGRHRGALTFEKGVENIFMGTAFLLITILGALFFRHGFMIWIWMLIPAFTMLGKGTSAMIRTKREQKHSPPLRRRHQWHRCRPRRASAGFRHRALLSLQRRRPASPKARPDISMPRLPRSPAACRSSDGTQTV